MKRKFKIVPMSLLMALASCGQNYELGTVKYPPVALPNPPAVCDPFGNSGDTNPKGPQIVGNLFGGMNLTYHTDANGQQVRDEVRSVKNFYEKDGPNFKYLLNASVFFQNINAPERAFSEGFSTQGGEAVKNPKDGQVLTEFFSLRMSSRIKLAAGDSEGSYQFAVVSDDGSLFYIGDDRQLLIDNDGEHPPMAGCARKPVSMKGSTRLPFELQYYQGPRYHIALTLLWRKVDPTSSAEQLASDEKCIPRNDNNLNSEEHDRYIMWEAPNNGRSGEYSAFLARTGFKPLRAENFELPEDVKNPCAKP